MVKEKKSEESKRTATVEELYQDCPKCNGEFLVKVQSVKGLDYLCYDCGYAEFRAWDEKKSLVKKETESKKEKKK